MARVRSVDLRDHFAGVRRSLETDCTACGLCVEVCPTFGCGVLEGTDAEEIAADRITMASTGVFHELAYLCARACLRCGACREVCPVDIDAAQANHVIRLVAAAGGPEVSERYAVETAGLRAMVPANPTNPFRMLGALQTRSEDVVWHTEIPQDPEKVDVLLFLSCVGMARLDRIRTLLDLMDLAGIRYAAIGGVDFCCGLLDALAGDLDAAQEHLDRLAGAVEAVGASELVTSCPSCFGWFSDLSRTQNLPFAFRHSTQLLAEHIDALPPRKTIEGCVTVHDPCHYGRDAGEWEPSRQLIEAIPGLHLVEMPRSRADTACCGGPAMGYQPEVGRLLTLERVQEAARVGAETIVSPCSGCVSSLEEAARRAGMTTEDVVTLLARALGIEHENRLTSLLAGESKDEILGNAAGGLWEEPHLREDVEHFIDSLLVRRGSR